MEFSITDFVSGLIGYGIGYWMARRANRKAVDAARQDANSWNGVYEEAMRHHKAIVAELNRLRAKEERW